jgi:Phospholipase_D-nuclease N-terminal/Short C-terminal domain
MPVGVYPFWGVFGSMLIFFIWIAWFMLLFRVFGDVFRRDDLSGWGKTGWIVFVIILPFLGIFIYLITQNHGMAERNMAQSRAQRAQFDDHVREAAASGGSAAEIQKAKELLDSGAITPTEFDVLKQRALA